MVEQLTKKMQSKLRNMRDDKLNENVLTAVQDRWTRHAVRWRTQHRVEDTVRWVVRWNVRQVARWETYWR